MVDEPQAVAARTVGPRGVHRAGPLLSSAWPSGWKGTCRRRRCWPRSARKCSPRPSCRWRSISCWASCGTRACSARPMARLPHYFTPFQAFVIQESENERLRFDLRVGLEILRREAEYRAERADAAGNFSLSVRVALPQPAGLRPRPGSSRRRSGVRRNVARLDPQAAAADRNGRPGRPDLRAQRILLAASREEVRAGNSAASPTKIESPEPTPARPRARKAAVVLFGEREGRIALANRKKDPLYLFSSLHRQLGYPEVPRLKPADQEQALLPQLARRLEQLETRLKIMEEEQRGGLDLTQVLRATAAVEAGT